MQDKESKKTLIYVLVAGMALLVAWEPWRPAPADTSVPERVGEKLFPNFENPLAAKSLEVVTFNESDATLRDFKVAQENGVWSIPSHSGYPADAKDHMAKAATALMDIKVLGVVSDLPGDQKIYGVVTPDPAKLKVGETGVGTRVTVRDGSDKVLADLVIGKAVKDSPQQRYVREAGRDAIYTVAVSTNEFSTKFGDWIEKDLLQLNAFDVKQIDLNDYSIRQGITPDGQRARVLDQRSQIELAFDDAKNQWSLVELKEFNEGQPTTVTLTENEELNSEKLNAMKTALDDLKIVDVERKPAGLSHDLKTTDDFAKNREAIASLQPRGFFPAAIQDGPMQIFSVDGEVTAATKEGVKYILRFGNLADAGTEGEQPAEGDTAEKKEGEGETESTGPSRYLFVTAQFDENMIPKPELQPLPGEEKPAEPAADEKPAENPAAEETPAAEKPADGESTAENAPAEESPAEAQPAEEKPAEEQPAADKPADESPVPETKTAGQEPDAEKSAKEDTPMDKPASDDKPAAAQPAENKPADKPGDKTAEAEKKEPTVEEAERLAIEKENKRRQDEYDAKVKAGQEKVKQLNERFADWYYIIPDDTYKKIHLGRQDIIKPKPVDMKKAGNLDDLNQGLGTPAVP
jgi:hypothetical protein